MTEAPPAGAPAPTAVPRWGLFDVLVGFVLAQVGGAIAVGIVLSASGRADDQVDELPIGLVALAQLGLWFGLLGVPWLVTRLKGSGLVRDLGLRCTWRDLWVGGGLGVLLQLVVVPLISWPWLRLLDRDASELEEPARELADRATGAGGVVLLILIVGIGAPIVEEIFYRGLFQRSLLKRGVAPAVALPLVALCFAGSHFQLLQFPALAAFGLTAGWLARRHDRLGPAIACHVAFNLVSVLTLLALE